MIFFTGSGSFLTRVGMARIWSPWANWGFTSRSITSMLYCPLQVLRADLFQVVERGNRLGGLARDIQP